MTLYDVAFAVVGALLGILACLRRQRLDDARAAERALMGDTPDVVIDSIAAMARLRMGCGFGRSYRDQVRLYAKRWAKWLNGGGWRP